MHDHHHNNLLLTHAEEIGDLMLAVELHDQPELAGTTC